MPLSQSTLTLLHRMAASYARAYVEYWAETAPPSAPLHPLPQPTS